MSGEKPQTRTIRSSATSGINLAVLFLIFTALSVWLYAVKGNNVGIFGTVLFGAGFLLCVVNLFRGVPRLVLDKDGLAETTAFYHRRWKWDDVGPFHLGTFQFAGSSFTKPQRFACAMRRHNHEMLAAGRATIPVTFETADIKIGLHNLPVGKSARTAHDFIAELNGWRTTYASLAPRTAAQAGPGDLAALAKKINNRQHMMIAFLVVAIVLFAIYATRHFWWPWVGL